MNLKAWHVLLVALVFGGLMAVAMQAGAEWRQYQGPDMMRVSQTGHLYAQFRNRIFVYGRDGAYRKTIHLAQWGIEQSTGGFDVFSNGDLLMLEGSHQQGAFLKLLTYLRMEKILTGSKGTADSVRQLVRCSIESGKCLRLEHFSRTFASTFRLYIDAQDRVFLADTSRDTVSWLMPDGALLDEVDGGFRFPNQLAVEKDNAGRDVLVVANTNHHALTIIPLQEKSFAPRDQWRELKVDGTVAASTQRIWPLESVLAGNSRYVLQQDGNMGHGVVMQYSREGEYITQFTMPADSDVMSMAVFNGDILVGDVENLKIWRYDQQGKLRGDFTSPDMEDYIRELAAKKQFFQAREKLAWQVFSGLLAIGFVVAIIGEQVAKKQRQEQAVADGRNTLVFIQQQGESEQPSADDPYIHWLAKDARRIRIMRMVFGGVILLLVAGNVLQVAGRYAADDAVLQDTAIHGSMMMQAAVLFFLIGLMWFMDRMFRKISVGVLREWIVLRDARGKTAVGRHGDVLLFPNAMAIGNVIVNIGLRQPGELPEKSILDRHEMQQWLAPRLVKAREQSGLDGILWHCRKKPLQTVLLVLLVILILGLQFLKA